MVNSYNWTVPATFNGYTINGTDYQILVAAWDASPNHNEGAAVSSGYITLQPADTTPPTVTLTAPNSGTFTVGSQVTLSATASDASGISYCEYALVKSGTVLGIIYQDTPVAGWSIRTIGPFRRPSTATR